LVLISLFIFLGGSVLSLIFYTFFDSGLHAANQPFIIYLVKWIYALFLVWSLMNLNKKPNLSWTLINIVSLSVLLLTYVIPFIFLFYRSAIDMFFLEFISIFLIVYANLTRFIKRYNIQRKPIYLLPIFIIPPIVTYFLYIFLSI